MGLVALFSLGMAMNDAARIQDESPANPSFIVVTGTIISTGSCVALQTCTNGNIYNLVGLPSSYSVGDVIELKGTLTFFTSVCYPTAFTINIGKLRPSSC
ncbi:MAG: hypothetical protein AAGN35_23255 [Bacteroidota bacterium]